MFPLRAKHRQLPLSMAAGYPALAAAVPIISAIPWRKDQGKVLDVGQKKTCGKEMGQKD